MLTWKEVARPGPVWYVDEKTGQPRLLDITPEMTTYWHDSGKEMLKAGLSIPIPLEHDRSVVAMTQADRAASQLRNNTGEVKDYAIRHGNRLFAQVDIQDEEIARKIPRTIKFTSPYFNSFTDGNGKKWDGVITHLALTSRPRITQQEPFGGVAAALSLAAPIKADSHPTGIFLSRAGLLDRVIGKPGVVPHYPMAFSVLSGVKLAEEYDEGPPGKEPPPRKEAPSDASSEKKGESEGKNPEGGKKPGQGEMRTPEDTEMDPEMGMVDVLCDMASALWGVDLPEGTTEDNLMQRLIRAMLDKLKMDNGESMPEEEEMAELDSTMTKPPPAKKPPITQEQPPVFMSLEQVNALPEGDMKRMATAMLSMQEQAKAQASQTEALKKNVFDAARLRREQRIDRVARKVGKTGYREELLAASAGIALALGDDGSVNDPFDQTLNLLEKGIKDLPQLLKTSAGADEIDHPVEAGVTSEERRQQIVKEFKKNAGVQDIAPAKVA